MTDEEAIKEIIGSGYGREQCHEETMRRAEDALRERIERKNGGWISVKDNLPEKYGTYLVYLGMPDKLIYGSGVHTAWYYDGSKEFSFSLNAAKMLGENDSTKIRSASVTHWMPLPEPPKEEKP